MAQQILHKNSGNLVETGSSNPMPVRPSGSDNDWSYAPSTPVSVNTNILFKSGSAGQVIFLTAIQLKNIHATVSTEVVVKSGANILFRTFLNVNMLQGESYVFPTPLKTVVADSLTFQCITAGASVYVNAQGYAIS